MPTTTLVVIIALVFNGTAAIAFGFLYRQRGLEATMLAHFICDFVIYVVGAELLKR